MGQVQDFGWFLVLSLLSLADCPPTFDYISDERNRAGVRGWLMPTKGRNGGFGRWSDRLNRSLAFSTVSALRKCRRDNDFWTRFSFLMIQSTDHRWWTGDSWWGVYSVSTVGQSVPQNFREVPSPEPPFHGFRFFAKKNGVVPDLARPRPSSPWQAWSDLSSSCPHVSPVNCPHHRQNNR